MDTTSSEKRELEPSKSRAEEVSIGFSMKEISLLGEWCPWVRK
jgi:hypothetical protein